MPKILIIENDASVAASLKQALETETYDYEDEVEAYAVELMTTAAEGLARATEGKFDALVTDLELAGPNGSELDSEGGLTLVRELHAKAPRLPVILMTAYHTSQTAIEAIRLGAYDYISKPLDMTALLDMIEQAVASSRRMLEPVALPLDATVAAPPNAVRIIGSSRVMESVYKEIGRVAATAVTVLIRGETGTGKELVARAIYQHSDRADKPFVVVNCAAIPETLLESELFGHEKGAFTGATERQIGRFEQANQGTIFLDEIGDMTMSTQAKLLRALEAKTINRLGGKEPIPINIRVIAATHKNLEQAILDKQFREDLFYRLNVAVIQLPPLRERKEDAPDLVRYFLQRHGPELGAPSPSITDDAIEFLKQQPWPGNVRQLENVVRKAVLLARGFAVTRENIEHILTQTRVPRPAVDQPLADYVSELLAAAVLGELQNVQGVLTAAVERELYAQAIARAQGNQAKAAKWLGVSRPTMREKLNHYGLRAPSAEG